MKNVSKFSWVIYFLLIIPLIISCKKTTTEPDVIADFTYLVSTTDFKKVAFTSTAQNYASLKWDFGDQTSSTEANPVHTFTGIGTFAVKLTATSPAGVNDVITKQIIIADPNAELTKLVGETSKTWKLLRVTTSGRYPLEVGPEDHSTIWWAMGKDNNEIANRPCMLNDEWTFGRDGSLKIDLKGDYWAEGGIFMPENICASTDQMLGPNGEDLSAWGGGNFTFVLTSGATPTLKAVGLGAYVGFFKLGNGSETKVPLESVTYNIIALTDGPVDTLIVEGIYKWDPTLSGGYWRFVLMHYDNPADEPPIPGNKPNTNFSTEISGQTVIFNNTTSGADSYLWDFGDGQTSTEQNPTHTYTGGPFTVTLSATNSNGTSTASAVIFISTADLTDAMLQGAAWKVLVSDKSVFVGPGLGRSDWWTLPKSFMTGGTGGDDWTCLPDDEFTFGAGGSYTYNTMGSARNDNYFGDPNGCWSDVQIAASTTGGAAFGSATHTYVLTPATGTTRPIITLTNGTLTGGGAAAAFLGFYKGYYGGENAKKPDLTYPPANGGFATNTYEVMGYANTGSKEYLFVSVDITATHDGTSAWSVILER
ncbi:MAG: PKD domain-containing protein [Bacteroidales bacterium]